MARVRLAKASEIYEGDMIERSHEGRSVLLAKVDGTIYAMDNICNHQGACLHEGELGEEGEFMVTCPWHDAHFDLRDGAVSQDTPWAEDTTTFPVSVEGDDVFVEL